jgi:hypothetical protein
VRALRWRQVPSDALALAKSAADAASSIREAISELPPDCYLDIWYSPVEKVAAIYFGEWTPEEDADRMKEAVSSVVPLGTRGGNVWVKVATQPPGILYEKRAFNPTARAAGSLGGYFPDYFGKIPGVPSPLAAMLASGALGAGLGYGTGWVAEKFLPEKWQRNRLRRTLAVMGGLGAAAPAAIWGASNMMDQGLPGLVSGSPLDTPPDVNGVFRDYNAQGVKTGAFDHPNAFTAMGEGDTGAFPAPIDAEKLVRTVYAPPVAQQLTPQMQAATTGLVVGAGHHQTGGSYMPRLVSPVAVGQMAAGMGSGWLSGMLVGKVLGALTGMPDSAQQRLKNTGLWAGAIANMVPLAFPGR